MAFPRFMLASFLMLLGCVACEPGAQTGHVAKDGAKTKDGAAAELGSCCDEPTPTLADLRKAAAKDEDTQPLPEAPSKVDAKPQPEEAKGILPPDKRDKLELTVEEGGEVNSAFHFTDQDGQPFESKQLKGKPFVATFIFTRCPNPQMCPLQGAKMAALQKALAKEGLSDKVNLLLFTFDPNYDTPQRLKEWGQTQGIAFTNAKMLRPDPREYADFKYEFQFRAFPTPTGELNHKTDLMLIDSEGRLAAFYGGMWDDAKVKAEVEKLIAETK
jgi:protein SCO1/2